MTMLPDIDQQDWDEYQRQQVQKQLNDKIQSFGLQSAIQEKVSGLQGLLGGQPEPAVAPPPPAPEPAPPPPEPAPLPPPPAPEPPSPEPTPNLPSPSPEPAPIPGPEPAPEQPAAPLQVAAPAPEPAPVSSAPTDIAPAATDTAPPKPTGPLDQWYDQLWRQGVTAVIRSGGDAQKFGDDLWERLNKGVTDANDAFGQGLGAAQGAGVTDLQAFANIYDPKAPPSQTAAPPPGVASGQSGTSGTGVSGVPGWLSTLISSNAPGDLASDPDFIRTVAAGAKAESNWDPNAVQKGGGGRGLFQFDLGGMGAPYANNESVLLGDSGAQLQASQIVPLYAKAYQSAPQGLTGAEKASWVAAQAERPYDYQNPNSSARRNYASAYGGIGDSTMVQGTQGSASTQDLLGRTGSWTPPAKQISQFNDPQLSVDESYAACGPAAAVRFAQMYGRNPTLREATDLAATVGWTSGSGMAGIGSEKALMDKMGVATKLVGPDVSAMAAEAQTGNPVTISTSGRNGGHYFFADGYNSDTGAFHVGQSGLDLIGGSEWMTPAQMQDKMGTIQGALFADHPNVPAPSRAEQDTNPASWLGKQKDAILGSLGFQQDQKAAAPPVQSSDPAVVQLDQAIDQTTSKTPAVSPQPILDEYNQAQAQAAAPPTQPEPEQQSPVDRLKGAFGDFLDSLSGSGAANVVGDALQQTPSRAASVLGLQDAATQHTLDVGGELASAAGSSVQERLGDIERPDTGNPLGDLLDTGKSVLGTGAKAGFDVLNEVMAPTHLGRIYEGMSGDIRRDPEYNQLMGQLEDLQGALYGAGSGQEQDAIRQQMRDTQDAIDQRKQDVFEGTGVTDLESAYRRGLASPDRNNAEIIANLAALPLAAIGGAAEAPALARTAAQAIADPLGPLLRGATGVARGLAGSDQAAGLAREAGSVSVPAALRMGGAAAGGLAGNASTPEDASPQERAIRTLLGAGAGLGGAEGVLRAPAAGMGAYRAALRATAKAPEYADTTAAGGSKQLDTLLNMMTNQDAKPPVVSDVVNRIQDLVGLGGRTGDLDKMLADKYAYINQVTGRARQALGSAFTPDMDAEAYVAGYAGRGARALQRVREGITPAVDLVRDTGDIDNLNVYRKLMRDIEVGTVTGNRNRASSGGITGTSDAVTRLLELRKVVGPDRFNKIKQADDILNKSTAQLLLDRAKAGLIDPTLAADLIAKMPHYNPTVFMKHLDEAHEGASSGGTSFQVGTNMLKRLAEDGGVDDTEKPLRSLVRHFVQNDVLVNRNETAKAIIKAARNDPELAGEVKKLKTPMVPVTGPEIRGPAGQALNTLLGNKGGLATVLTKKFGDIPGTMSLYENGKRVYYKIPEELESAVKGLDHTQVGLVEKGMQKLNSPLRWGATAASPPFLVTNAVADAVQTFLREGTGTAARIPMGWYAAAKQNGLYQDYIKAGGGMESLFQRSPQDLDKLVEDTGGLLAKSPNDIPKIALDALKLKWIQRAGEVIEQGPRLATFERHLKAGDSAQQAAMAGRRATVDFSRSGDAIRQANAVSLFLNARVQGNLNTFRTLRDVPAARRRLMGLGMLNSATYAHNRDYPEYWDVPKYIRDQNMVWMLPGSQKDPNGPGYKKLNYIAVPLREWGAFTAPLNYGLASIDHEHGHDPRTFGEFAQNQISQFSPLAGEDVGSGAAGLVPAPLRTPMEIGANRRFFTGLPIVPEAMQGLPPSQQIDERTSAFSKKFSQAFPNVSPKVLDFIINENLGGAGKAGLGASDQLADWANQSKILGLQGTGQPEDRGIPVVGGLTSGIRREFGGQLSQDQYDQLNKLMSQHQEPIANSIRQLPEYTTASKERQDQMVRTGQTNLEDHFRDQLGITKDPHDLGLPPKYVGVTDPQRQVAIDDALAKNRAYDADPKNNPKPSPAEVKLALTYEDQVSLKYQEAKAAMDKRNAAIGGLVEKQLAQARG